MFLITVLMVYESFEPEIPVYINCFIFGERFVAANAPGVISRPNLSDTAQNLVFSKAELLSLGPTLFAMELEPRLVYGNCMLQADFG